MFLHKEFMLIAKILDMSGMTQLQKQLADFY